MKNTSEETQKLQLPTDNVDSILGFSFISGAIHHELRICWAFTSRDWSASVIPGAMYTTAALRSLESTPTASLAIQSLARCFIYFLLYIYAFDIANQINGIAEDEINKPDRPLPSGLVSLQGAYIRWYATTTAHLVVGAAWGVLPWTALWVLITIYTSFYGGDKHWVTKNMLFMSVGSICLLQAAWALAAPLTAREWRWALLLSGILGIVASVQDIRDLEGDKIAGRRTLPVVLGSNFRWVMATIISTAPLVCWMLDLLVCYCGFGLALTMFYLAFRVLSGCSKEYDHKTYMMLTYIYCGCIAVRMVFP
ncbi:UbiA prenyltransferase family-domain-containing protein [Mycena alexandri]|uniref:UbiA prenyltransferase family-domain-containing protein n=1 Tax=Mycena alexandri TaxID=1745969 RepID=A0AAD6TAZ0_9AGAR|nr:UbiA prenyltransferase family-domain-containing protein [Mycena alexandri]